MPLASGDAHILCTDSTDYACQTIEEAARKGAFCMTEALQKMNDAITLLAINDLMLRQRNISEAEHAAIKQKIERMYL